MVWYYAKNGDRRGPIEETEFQQLVATGAVHPDDLVWREDFGDAWRVAKTVPELNFPARPVLPPPAPNGAADPNLAPDTPFRSDTHNRDLMAVARASLSGNWGIAIGVEVVMFAIQIALSVLSSIPFVGLVFYLGNFLISGALALGVAIFWLSLSRTGQGEMGQAFQGFARFGTAFLANLLMVIFVILWSLLLIVPGIIAGLRYSQTWYILADNPQMDALEAIRRSKQMMHGNKWKFFCLQWRFFGWALLCLLTCGIGFLWLGPYISMSNAKFYDDLKS
jgi:uncharacterized membrane protein